MSAVDAELASAFATARSMIAEGLVETTRIAPRFREQLEQNPGQLSDLIERELVCLVDYAKGWIAEDNDAFRALYIGERSKIAYTPGDTAETRNALLKKLVENDARVFLNSLGEISDDARTKVVNAFENVAAIFNRAFSRELKILLIGDCVHLDVIAFLTGHAAGHDIALAPHFLADKNPAKVINELHKLGDQSFDVIFYSPFTYEYNGPFMQVLNWRNAAMANAKRQTLLDEIFAGVDPVVDVLAKTFSAPIFIHNAAVIIRSETGPNSRLKHIITKPLRSFFCRQIDSKLTALIDELNNETFPHLHKIDETKFLTQMSEDDLGRYFYYSPLQHPACLGAALAEKYASILNVVAHLFKKKMVVCDLDNTLWGGVIGDGEVSHFTDRQRTLKNLKDKGVLLSIASKNDPANVHWTGSILSEDDFVYSHISWSPKITAFAKMQDVLNLKLKDFVFVDDRPDERAFVAESYPHVRTFDATAQPTWEAFALWERMLDESPDMDRTKMYHDRAKRQAFTADLESDVLDESEMFKSLGLELNIWQAEKKDIPRATELINRTNQFNMQGSRTTFAQMSDWQAGSKQRIYLASMSDKFGDMGVVSVLVADYSDNIIGIPVFVLSCRVFGYGVEVAILNCIKRSLGESGACAIEGQVVETPVNMPCREVYRANGFVEEAGVWRFAKTGQPILDPDWLTVNLA